MLNVQDSESEDFFIPTTKSRQSHKVGAQLAWDRLVVSALEVADSVNPYEADLPEGTVIRAIDALHWSVGRQNCDIRPRLVDKSSGISRLLDTGSQISVTKRLPEDKIDN